MSIQYHPEASPGPHDSDICFDQFIAMLEEERSAKPPMVAV
jgi:carbamoyl-phosphate synthase small subunit